MGTRLYVYSTLATDMAYTNHETGGADIPVALEPVFIKGGAGVANDRFVTPRGVATEITEKQAEYLQANQVFQLHQKNGYVMIDSESMDPDKMAANMTGRDNSAPIVHQDLPPDTQPTESEVKPDPDPLPVHHRKRR